MSSDVWLEKRIPRDHPLRPLRRLMDRALQEISPQLDALYANGMMRPSVEPEKLLRALLLQFLYAIRSERQLMEHLDYNLLHRWFVGLASDEPVWDPAVLTMDQNGLRRSDLAQSLFEPVLRRAYAEGLLSIEDFTVAGSRLASWAGRKDPGIWLFVVFFLSGTAALIYQLIWQRVLFTIYGVDIASVTVVITAFLLGLGFGSLVGGVLSRTVPRAALPLFAAFELGLGLFGFFSLDLFGWVAAFTLGVSHLATGLITLLLVLFPTTLMGTTLPLLVVHATQRSGNVGRSVGKLYFVNTLGAAVGCFVVTGFLLALLGLAAAVRLTALLNVGLGVTVIVCTRLEARTA